ncbi:MAG TPA: hypothetical protein VGO62_18285, partial [Myxococcota bacterium]
AGVDERDGVCVALVLDNKVLIGVLTAVRWFLKTHVEMRYFNTALQAFAWIEELMAAEHLEMKAGTREALLRLDAAHPEDPATL